MVGFNRRFAPYTEVLKNIPEKQTIFIKNRINTTRETSFMMYDLFYMSLIPQFI